jgi:cytochrome c oxidase subunit 1
MHFMTGLPRRYYSHAEFDTFSNFGPLNEFISIMAIVVFFAQLIFILNFFYSIFKGRKMTDDNLNPWGANSIEWTTPVKGIHGNWPGKIPEVYRWPYDYEVNGKEFIPQTEPLKDGETAH